MEDEELLNKDNPLIETTDRFSKKYGNAKKKLSKLSKLTDVSSNVGFNTGIGDSSYDDNFMPNLVNSDDGFAKALGKYRASVQPASHMIGNAAMRITNVIPGIIGNFASIEDLGDQFTTDFKAGNVITEWAKAWKQSTDEAFPIYRENPGKSLDLGDPAYWVEQGSGLVNSAIEFGISGGILSKGLTGLSKIAKLRQLSNAVAKAPGVVKLGLDGAQIGRGAQILQHATIMNGMEGTLTAADTFDSVYQTQLADYLGQGLSNEEAHTKATADASEGAAATYNANKWAIPLNLISSGMFMKKLPTRGGVEKPGWKADTKAYLGEGVQEYGEETINFLAGNYGEAKGTKKKYGFNEIIKDLGTPEAFESGILGFLGGVGQTAFTKQAVNRINKTIDPETGEKISIRDYNKKVYNDYKDFTDKLEAVQKDGDISTFTNSFETLSDQIKLKKAFEKAEKEGNIEEAKRIAALSVDVQAYDAFTKGATDVLVETYESIRDGEQKEGLPDNYKEKATEAIKKIETLEKFYNDSYKYANRKQVYLNKANRYQLENYVEEINTEINKVTNSLNGFINKISDISDNVKGDFNKTGYFLDINNIDFNPAKEAGDTQAAAELKEIQTLIKASPDYKFLQEAKATKKDVVKQLKESLITYNEITSDKYQESFKKRVENASADMQSKIDELSAAAEVDASETSNDLTEITNTLEEDGIIKKVPDDIKLKINSDIKKASTIEDLENIIKQLKYLKKTDSKFSTSKIAEVENLILNKLIKQEETSKVLNDIIEKYKNQLIDINKYLDKRNTTINKLLKKKDLLIKGLSEFNESLIGRNSKLWKSLIEDSKKELDEVLSEIKKVKNDIKNINETKKDIVNKLNLVTGRNETISKVQFESINDIINYLEDFKEQTDDHRFDLIRLTTHKYYSDLETEALKNKLNKLEDYQSVLKNTLDDLEPDIFDDDQQFLIKELENTFNDISDVKILLSDEIIKNNRLQKAINNKNIINQLNTELDIYKGLNNIEIPNYVSKSEEVEEVIIKKEAEVAKKAEADRQADIATKNAENAQAVADKAQAVADTKENLEVVANNYNEGEVLDLENIFGEEYKGISGTVITVEENADGTKVATIAADNGDILSSENAITKPTQDVDTDDVYNTDGSAVENTSNEDSVQESNDKADSDEATKDGNKLSDVKLMSTYRDSGKPLKGIPEAYLEYETNPVDKIGTKVYFEINKSIGAGLDKGNNFSKATKIYNDFITNKEISEDDKNFMVDYLSFKAKIDNSDVVYTFLESKPNTTNPKSLETYNNRTRPLRISLIKQLKDGNDISTLYTTVKGQYGGQIQLDAKGTENSILDLNDIDSLDDIDLYIIDGQGQLKDISGDNAKDWYKTKKNWKGSIYMKTKLANGNPFYLNLNFGKVKPKQAEVIFEVYRSLLQKGNRPTSLVTNLSPQIQSLIKKNLKPEIDVIKKTENKPFNEIILSELLDLIFWDGSDKTMSGDKNIKSRLNINYTTKSVEFGDKSYKLNEFTDDKKAEFVDWVSKNKNRNFKFKPKRSDINQALNSTSIDYLQYAIDEKIINTNAKVNQPLFKGFTNLYLTNAVAGGNISKPTIINTGFNKATDTNLKYADNVDGKNYYASADSGRVFLSKDLKDINGRTPYVTEQIGKLVTDVNLIGKIETNIRGNMFAGAPNITLKKTFENKAENTRISQNNFVPLQENSLSDESVTKNDKPLVKKAPKKKLSKKELKAKAMALSNKLNKKCN